MRISEMVRTTNETDISLKLNLDGTGRYNIITDCGFFKHMMELFTKHGNFDIDLCCKGDSEVDYHHTVEDVGITLGKAFKEALKDKKGIYRYADIILPMDESLILSAVDISGRSYLNFDVDFPEDYKIGDFDAELVKEFLLAFVRNAEITLHVIKIRGENNHHIAEGVFKAVATVMKQAVSIDEKNKNALPSTKGVI